MSFSIEQVIGARVAQLRRERGMTQVEFGQALEPYTGTVWSRQNLGSAESGRRGWTANDMIAVAMVLDATIADLLTPTPEMSGDLRTTGGATVTAPELAMRTARPLALPAADAADVTRDAENLYIKVKAIMNVIQNNSRE